MHGFLAGYRLDEPVTTVTWRAHDAVGTEVWLRVLPEVSPPTVRDRLAAAEAVAEPTAAGLVPVLAVVSTIDGVVVVSPACAPLDRLLTARGRLAVGEVVTVGAGVAALLDRLHAAGLVHGRLRAGNLLFAPDGRPLLADVAAGPDPGADARGDVRDLVAVLAAAAGGSGDPHLVGLLAAWAEPAGGAGELAARLLEVAPARPVRLVAAAPPLRAGAAATDLDDALRQVAAGLAPAAAPAPPRARTRLARMAGAGLLALAVVQLALSHLPAGHPTRPVRAVHEAPRPRPGR